MGPGGRAAPLASVPTVTTPDEDRDARGAPLGDLTVRAERMVAGGEALARRPDGRIVLVAGALPGETVAVDAPVRRAGADRATVVAVVEASANRIAPPCPRRTEGCGGCDWQHLAPAAQLPEKVGIVVDALRRTGRLGEPDVRLGASVPAEGYRTTVRLVGTDDGVAGYRRERSHDTVSAEGCLVAHPRLGEVIPQLRPAPGLEVTLRCSAATGEMVALWRDDRGHLDGVPPAVRVGTRAGFTEVVHHGPTARDDTGRTSLHVSAGSFFQSGPAAAALLVDAVATAAPELAEARHVVDLYGGVGLFAASVVPPTAAVTLVESNRSATGDAVRNLPDATVVRGDAGRWRPASGAPPVDVVVADPPRAGLGRAGTDAVVSAGAATVVLVSCDPVTAARDAALLREHGYVHDHVVVLDLFPGTHHVETVTRFTRARRTGRR